LLIGFILCSCLTKNQKGYNKDIGQDWSYENNVRILSYLSDGTMDNIFNDCEPLEFSLDDFIKIDNILNRFIEEYNVIQLIEYNKYREKFPRNNIDKYYFLLKEVKYYSRQYIGIINNNGEKEVWINCFPNSSKGMPEEILFIVDGGTDFLI
jgi:cupin superfamily acireductone dioxygenase involved in methionine salvage